METLDFSYTGKLNGTISESIVPPILQGSFGILGNFLALFLLFRHSKVHLWGAFYKYVFALAVTDVNGLICHYPVAIARYATDFEFDFPKEYCYFDVFLFSFSFLSSAMIVCAMSCDRLFAIKYPIIYRSGNHKTKRILITIWIFSALVASFPLLGFGSVQMYYPGTWCFINFASRRSLDRINTYVYSSLCLLILFITAITNTAVIHSICQHDRTKIISSSGLERRKRKNGETYIVTLMLSIVVLFSVCWIPLMVGTCVAAAVIFLLIENMSLYTLHFTDYMLTDINFINSSQNEGLSPSCIALSFDGPGSISWHSIWCFSVLIQFSHFFSNFQLFRPEYH
jgi:hypothetical protein